MSDLTPSRRMTAANIDRDFQVLFAEVEWKKMEVL